MSKALKFYKCLNQYKNCAETAQTEELVGNQCNALCVSHIANVQSDTCSGYSQLNKISNSRNIINSNHRIVQSLKGQSSQTAEFLSTGGVIHAFFLAGRESKC